ncbi:MAG TPA: hypothetical protein VFA09_27000 [Ktedonobacteraceae bacterium]|nr:hypothetical protein [Ktedonobacteraceae bacterium]
MSELHEYQVDHLLLLVGSNPVPNAVAGKLLIAPGGTITLIHSKEGLKLAQRLQTWLDSSKNFGFKEVEESNAASVSKRVQEALDKYERTLLEESDSNNANKEHEFRLGLNYTGGTKVMSVHAYRALEKWVNDPKRRIIFSKNLVFSYLDARTLKMCFEPVQGQPTTIPVGNEVEIKIEDLLKLHNWKFKKSPTWEPVLPQSAAALLAIHSNPAEARIWTTWLYDELFRNAKRQDDLRSPFWVLKDGKEQQGQLEVKYADFESKWKSKGQLRELKISWPNLPDLRETMSNELGQSGTENLDLAVAKGKGFDVVEDFCKWLSGIWLESAVLTVLQNCSQELGLKECCMDLQPEVLDNGDGKTGFQFDVAALCGYQLFAFSCSTESGEDRGGRGLLKQKLFEAYIRARQMGGDEACVALVCCAKPEMTGDLENEIRHVFNQEGRIRVFGREHLANLAENIADWIRRQSKEG